MIKQPTKAQKEKSKLTKEEWREYTKTVWRIANTSDPDHPAVFPVEIPRRLIKLFSFHGETVLSSPASRGCRRNAQATEPAAKVRAKTGSPEGLMPFARGT